MVTLKTNIVSFYMRRGIYIPAIFITAIHSIAEYYTNDPLVYGLLKNLGIISISGR